MSKESTQSIFGNPCISLYDFPSLAPGFFHGGHTYKNLLKCLAFEKLKNLQISRYLIDSGGYAVSWEEGSPPQAIFCLFY